MRKVKVLISIAPDGFYAAYCEDHPAIFGGGVTPADAINELRETIRQYRESGDKAAFHPDWFDEEYEFVSVWDIEDLMAYYAGVITPAALSRLSGIHPKQIWSYMHGKSKPRKAQIQKMESALHRLGAELSSLSLV